MKTIFKIGAAILAVCLAVPFVATAASFPTIRSGAICNETYQQDGSDWRKETLYGSFDGCSAFLSTLGTLGTNVFYTKGSTTMPGVRALDKGFSQEKTVEDADIVYVTSHSSSAGSATGVAGYLVPFTDGSGNPVDTTASTFLMSLGDTGRGLSVLSIWGCSTLAPFAGKAGTYPRSDFGRRYTIDVGADLWSRWKPAMLGGLRYVTGAWDAMYIGANTTDGRKVISNVGRNFADYLKNGGCSKTPCPLKEAWQKAVFDGNQSNSPAVMSTGTSESDCFRRLNGMDLTNMTDATTFPRIKGTIPNYCWQAWW